MKKFFMQLFFMFVLATGYCSVPDNADSVKYTICFVGYGKVGWYKNVKVKIYTDGDLYHTKVLNSRKEYYSPLVGCVEINYLPKKIKIVINGFTVIRHKCNGSKPNLYLEKYLIFYVKKEYEKTRLFR